MGRDATWEPRDGSNPYGLPGAGNGAEVWRALNAVPCPKCGATRKNLSVEKGRATIVCGDADDWPIGDGSAAYAVSD